MKAEERGMLVGEGGGGEGGRGGREKGDFVDQAF